LKKKVLGIIVLFSFFAKKMVRIIFFKYVIFFKICLVKTNIKKILFIAF